MRRLSLLKPISPELRLETCAQKIQAAQQQDCGVF